MEFKFRYRSQWISETLKTVISNNHGLKEISITMPTSIPSHPARGPLEPESDRYEYEEAVYLECKELVRILVQLWKSHSIHPRVLYDSSGMQEWCRQEVRARVEDMFLELVKFGAVDLVDCPVHH